MGCSGRYCTGMCWTDWLGLVTGQVIQVIQVIQVVQVVQVVRMISIDDMHSENIYGFHGLNHQITKES